MNGRETDEAGSLPDAIAVIGLAGRFPGARDAREFWRNVCEGREAIVDVDDEALRARGVPEPLLGQGGYVRRAAPLDGHDEFDAAFFGFTPRFAQTMDPQQRLFLECCWHAFEDAGYDPARTDAAVGVFASTSASLYMFYNLLSAYDPHLAMGSGLGTDLIQAMTGNDGNFIATRVSHTLDLRGPSIGVQTACSSALVAVHLAVQSLLSGECDMALAGAMSIRIPHAVGYLHEPGAMTSPDGRVRPFDARSNGTLFGSGGGAVLLKPLAAAVAHGDHIRAVIRGSAVNNDGSLKMGFTAPSVEAQAEAVAEAMAVADVAPGSVGYVEAHGTGTPLGDPVEILALTKAFSDGRRRARPCAVGSVKSNIGHLEVAAGIAGLIKAVLAVEYAALPPTLHFTAPNPELALDPSLFRIQDALEPWEGGQPRRAGISSLGMGGTNAHVVIEQAPPAPPRTRSAGPRTLLLSARSPEAVARGRERLAQWLDESPDADLADVAFTLAEGRRAFAHRCAVVARNPQEAATRLRDPSSPMSHTGSAAADAPSVALLFPGQGSQYAGMTAGLHAAEPVFRERFDECAALFSQQLGTDLSAVVFGADDDALQRTDLAQAGLFSVGYALAGLLESRGVTFDALLGHSVGEYAAACVAGVLSLPDAVRVVAARGRLMQQAAAGAMLSVRLGEQEARALLDGTGLEIAAVNEPGSCVLAGSGDAVGRMEARLSADGVRTRRLATAHAFHTAAVQDAADRFAEEIAAVRFAQPRVPMPSNVTGTWMTAQEATDPARWSRQMRGTVRFADGVSALLEHPGRVLVEAGPGRALVGAARRSAAWQPAHRAVQLVRHPSEPIDDHDGFLLGLGRLWAAGVAVEWDFAAGPDAPRRVPLPGYPFERHRHWVASRHPQAGASAPAPSRTADSVDATAAADEGGAATPPPLTTTESILQAIWTELLGIPDIGEHDNFFDLGGDSVVAVQVAARAHRAGVQFDPQDLFAHQTVAALAAVARRADTPAPIVTSAAAPASAAPPPDAPSADAIPLTPMQLMLLDTPGSTRFTVPVLFEGPAGLDPELVGRALAAVGAHHEILGLRVEARSGTWRQRIAAAPATVDLPVVPLRVIAPAANGGDRLGPALARVLTDLGSGFAYDGGPLWRAALLDTGEGPAYLALVLHHILADAAGERILVEDVVTAYSQLSDGRAVHLEPTTTPWRVWAARASASATDPRTLEEFPHWLAVRGGQASPPQVADRPGPAADRDGVRLHALELTVQETASLLDVQRSRRLQLDEILLGAVCAAHAALTGLGDLTVAVEGHGRAVDLGCTLHRTAGWCTTLFPVAIAAGRQGVGGSLDLARDALRSSPRQGLGFSALRFLHAPTAARLGAYPDPWLMVSYLGFADGPATAPDAPLRLSSRAGLPARLCPACLIQPVELRCYVLDGALRLDWWYDPDQAEPAFIETLAEESVRALRDAGALAQPEPDADGIAALPDFPLAGLSQLEMAALFGGPAIRKAE